MTATYSERLRAPWSWWAVGTVLVLTLGLAVGYPLGVPAGVLAGAVAEGAVAWLLLRSAALVLVDDGHLVAGPARLPLSAVTAALPLDSDAARLVRGRDADPRAYLLLRPWLPLAVRVDLDDPGDPTPYWYLSTRRPGELAAALAGAERGGPSGELPGRDDSTAQDGAG